MGISGYNGNLAVQPESAVRGIAIAYNYFPLALYVIIFILTMFYDMDKKKPQIQADLEARRAAK